MGGSGGLLGGKGKELWSVQRKGVTNNVLKMLSPCLQPCTLPFLRLVYTCYVSVVGSRKSIAHQSEVCKKLFMSHWPSGCPHLSQ